MTTTRPKPDRAYKMPMREAKANLRLAADLFWQVDLYRLYWKTTNTMKNALSYLRYAKLPALTYRVKRAYREAKADLSDQDKQIAAVLGGAVLILSALLIAYLYNLHNL